MNAPNAFLKLFSSLSAWSLLAAFLLLPCAFAEAGDGTLMSISRDADGNGIKIKFVGVLQSAETLAGPWSDESGGTPKNVAPSGAARYYRIKPFELPAAARFSVNLETGEIRVTPGSTLSRQGLHAAAVWAGSTIGFNSGVVLDEPGNPGRKVLSVSLVNQTQEPVGADPNGVVAGIKVLFGEFKNLSTPSDLRQQAMVSTLAGSGASGSTDGPALSSTFVNPAGVTTGPDGSIYVSDATANNVRKLSHHQVFTLAGSGLASSINGVGIAASFNRPWGIAYSAALNGIVIAERNGRRVRLLTLDGTVSTIAGTGALGSANGAGNVATFNAPTAVAVDGAGAIYIAEYPGFRIRKITLTGADPQLPSSYTVTTWAGSGVAGSLDGNGTSAQFKVIYGLVAQQDGTLYVADAGSPNIRRVSPLREVVTIAGNGVGSLNGPGALAKFKGPAGITLLNGSLVVTDYSDHAMRLLTLAPGGSAQNKADWHVRTLAGTGIAGTTDGRGDQARFSSPYSVTADGAGNLIVADYANSKLRKVTPTSGYFPVGIPAPTAVTEPIRLSNAEGFYSFTAAEGQAFRPFMDYNELLYPGATSLPRKWAFEVPAGVQGFEFTVTVMAPADTKVPMAAVSNPGPTGVGSPDVLVSTIAGSQLGGHVDGPATAARLNSAVGIATDQNGNLYVADTGNHAVRRISKDGMVSTVAGGFGSGFVDSWGDLAKFSSPRGIAVSPDGTTLFVADSSNHSIRRIILSGWDPTLPSSWSVSTIAGTTAPGYVDNTTGTAARFDFPSGIALAPGGIIYLTEFSGHRVRRLQPRGPDLQFSGNWHVSIVAGSTTGLSGNTDAWSTSARFHNPADIAVDQIGFLYVCDSSNNRIRKINPNGNVTTLAGSTYGYTDALGTSAQFGQPNGIAVDSAGYVYVADTSNQQMRRVSPAGMVTTVAGTGDTFPGDLDGTGDIARFYYPLGMTIDASGSLYVISGGTYLFEGGGGVTSPGLRVRMIQRILR